MFQLGTVAAAAAVLAHRLGWQTPITTFLFLLVVLLGSLGTLGRQADTRDTKVGTALAETCRRTPTVGMVTDH